MKKPKKERRRRALLRALRSYLIFFAVVAFVITCCTMLFVRVLSDTLGVTLTGENIGLAAKMTFVNVLIITLLFAVADGIRRHVAVSRPIKALRAAAEQLVAGDFSARIPDMHPFFVDEGFRETASCFNKMATELAGVETLRTDFIANVSHEMKTPLAVMQNYGRLLQQPGLEEEKRVEYAKAIVTASSRLVDMMTNVLKLTRLENQQIFPEKKSFALDEQLCECLLQFEDTWEGKEIELNCEIDPDVLVRADAELLALVWNNLLSNAFKFTERGGSVNVALRADAKYAFVEISDTGCGISPEVGAHIFEKFYQGDTSHATSGNGLGLALVKRVVDILHGEITVKSALGRGSTFTVRLPRE